MQDEPFLFVEVAHTAQAASPALPCARLHMGAAEVGNTTAILHLGSNICIAVPQTLRVNVSGYDNHVALKPSRRFFFKVYGSTTMSLTRVRYCRNKCACMWAG